MSAPAPAPVGPRPVVAGVDGSAEALQAACFAADEARRRSLPLLLVHATPWLHEAAAAPAPTPDIRRLLVEGGQAIARSAAEAVRERTDVTDVRTEVVDGTPVDALRRVSADAELLVLGRRGAGGLSGLLLGSTANGVVEHATCPVVVIPDDTSPAVSARRSVVVGVEGRPGDDAVLAFAFAAASLRRTDLVAVHAWRDVALETALRSTSPLVDVTGVLADEQRLLAEALAGWPEKEPDVPVRQVVVRDRSASALLAAALTAELLVVGHRHRGPLTRFGATTHAVLHRAPCPVAVVPLTSPAEETR